MRTHLEVALADVLGGHDAEERREEDGHEAGDAERQHLRAPERAHQHQYVPRQSLLEIVDNDSGGTRSMKLSDTIAVVRIWQKKNNKNYLSGNRQWQRYQQDRSQNQNYCVSVIIPYFSETCHDNGWLPQKTSAVSRIFRPRKQNKQN